VIEELKDPYRNLPKAIFFSIVLVTCIYTFTNIAYFTTVSPPEVLGGAAVAVVSFKLLHL
jgi:amino acid transporter